MKRALPRGKQTAAPKAEPKSTFLIRQTSDPGTTNAKRREKEILKTRILEVLKNINTERTHLRNTIVYIDLVHIILP